MAELPYHEVKDLIEKELDLYNSKIDEGTELPEIELKKQGKDTEISFKVNKHADFYKIAQIILTPIGKMEARTSLGNLTFMDKKHSICIHPDFFNSISYDKEGDLTSEELDSLFEAYKIGNLIDNLTDPTIRLRDYGVSVYKPDKSFSWDYLAGYDKVKQEIKDTVILSLKHQDIYDEVSKGTRKVYETNRPKAVLFEGPPGTGKTTMARVIAGEVEAPLVYVPVESIMTKWYGESERNLSGIFDTCNEMGNTLLFLDEIDSLATSRDNDIHEATRRVLSVLLRKIDGFEPNERTILIGATNRKKDLDAALLSRFDLSIYFSLPNKSERATIFSNYANQLDQQDLEQLARNSEQMSGRNIKDLCEHTERKWASKIIKGLEKGLPPLEEYLEIIKTREELKKNLNISNVFRNYHK